VEIGDEHQLGQLDDGWAARLPSLEDFPYAKFGIAAPANSSCERIVMRNIAISSMKSLTCFSGRTPCSGQETFSHRSIDPFARWARGSDRSYVAQIPVH